MSKNKGFSLLEVLVAFTILTVAMIPILSMYPAMFRMSGIANSSEELARLSLSVVDYIKSRGYNGLMNNTILFADENDKNFTGSYTLTEVSGAYTNYDFEDDFEIPNGFFLLNAKGLNLEGLEIDIKLQKQYFQLSGDYLGTKTYINPVTGTNSGLNFDLEILTTTILKTSTEFINATVTLSKDSKSYKITFVTSPIENWGG